MYSLEYALQCELMHGLLGLLSSFPLLGAFFLMRSRMESFCPAGKDTSHWLSLGRLSLLLACFGSSLVMHYIADMAMLPNGLWMW
jgi:hypothetical protein